MTAPKKKRSKNGGRFQKGKPGGPGRKPGVPNKATIAGRQFCQGLIDNPKYRSWLTKQMEQGTLSDSLQQMVWAYAIGKPSASVEDNRAGVGLLELLQKMHAEGRVEP